ncbi:AI-2E family transporter [Trichlorobacter ammonificans]|uniref:Predicted PurR-regulated permease PerM n=1 Tax=Trichlorobacter ammonificans TaxID=2916410 RepID=A0ABN8HH67_9BACT|nr:AI-2E family transporter [Trichlorobacter ammonificans]CAH2032173.1 Predicted PurR-regulated permease PerM [Trichlorobacter ammonificans]
MDYGLLKILSLFTAILALLYLLGAMLLPFLSPLAWALIIGIITFPLYRRLRRLCREREGTAAAAMTVLVMLVFVLPTVGLLVLLVQEVAALYRFLEQAVNSGTARELVQRLGSQPWVQHLLERLQALTGLSEAGLMDNLMANSKEIVGKVLGGLSSALANSFAFLFNMVFMLFILFFVYRDGEQVRSWLVRVSTLEGHRFGRQIPQVVQNVLAGFIFGTLLTSLLQGVLAGLAYWVAGVPSPLLLGLLTGIGGFVPLVGTAIIWLPAAIYLFVQGSAVAAVLLSLWGLLVVGMADNVVRPLFMSSKVSLPILPLMLGALGGLAAFGVLGAIFGPLLLAVLYELFVLEPPDESNTNDLTAGGEDAT